MNTNISEEIINADINTLSTELQCEVVNYDWSRLKDLTIQSAEVVDAALHANIYAFMYVKNRTEKMCLNIIKENPLCVRFLKDEDMTSSVIDCMLNLNLSNVRYIKNPSKKLCKSLISIDPELAIYINNLSEDMAMLIVSKARTGSEIFIHLPVHTENICKAAVLRSYQNIQYAKVITADIIMLAHLNSGCKMNIIEMMKCNDVLSEYVSNINNINDVNIDYVKQMVLDLDISYIKKFKTYPYKAAIQAVSYDSENVKLVCDDYKTVELYTHMVNGHPESIKYIKSRKTMLEILSRCNIDVLITILIDQKLVKPDDISFLDKLKISEDTKNTVLATLIHNDNQYFYNIADPDCDLLMYILDKTPEMLQYVVNQTEELCNIALHRNYHMFKYVKEQSWDMIYHIMCVDINELYNVHNLTYDVIVSLYRMKTGSFRTNVTKMLIHIIMNNLIDNISLTESDLINLAITCNHNFITLVGHVSVDTYVILAKKYKSCIINLVNNVTPEFDNAIIANELDKFEHMTNPSYNVCVEAVKYAGKNIFNVPIAYIDLEMLRLAIKSDSGVIKTFTLEYNLLKRDIQNTLKRANPKQTENATRIKILMELYLQINSHHIERIKNPTKRQIADAISSDITNVKLLRNAATIDGAILSKMVDYDGMLLGKYSKKLQTYDICVRAVTQNPDAICYVDESLLSTQLIMLSLSKNPSNIKYVANKSEAMCKYSISKDFNTLGLISEQTEELCLMAVNISAKALLYVKNITLKIALAAIKNNKNETIKILENRDVQDCILTSLLDYDWHIIKLIKAPTYSMCVKAIKINPLALLHLPREYFNDKYLQILAVSRDGLILAHIHNQNINLCLAAVRQNRDAIYLVCPILLDTVINKLSNQNIF